LVLVPTFRLKPFTFVHALNVFVSFLALLSLYKDCGSVKDDALLRDHVHRERGPNRVFLESLRRRRGIV
jgi:hypothetical protein